MKETFPKTKKAIDNMFAKEEKTAYELIVCKCFDCCAYNPLCYASLTSDDFKEAVESIKQCDSGSCVLAGYARQKKSIFTPKRKKREYTEEQKQAMRERMLHARKMLLEKQQTSI